MKISGTNIYMTRGDNESIGITLNGYTPSIGDFVEMTVRKSSKSDVLIHKKVEDAQDGKFIINILPDDTSHIPFGNYVYDIQLTYDGLVKTIVLPSMFTIGEEITYGDNS